jgi:hypothetical protein
VVDQKYTICYNVVIVNNKEQAMNIPIPDYSMFSYQGNLAVHGIVTAARENQLTWSEVYAALSSLARYYPDECGEATDTAVRECVYDALQFTESFYGV